MIPEGLVTKAERTIKFAAVVQNMTDAWAFVMDRIDDVGPDPVVSIHPLWVVSDDGVEPRKFEVAVSGMTEVEL